jgi:hypothetical protein
MSISQGNAEIKAAISNALLLEEGCLIGRNGQIELGLIINAYAPESSMMKMLETNAGIFPSSYLFDKWKHDTIQATRAADVLVTGWYEPLRQLEGEFLKKLAITAKQIPLRSLEPYYVSEEEQWTHLLDGHDVAVVSSFTYSAQEQLKKNPSDIWGQRGVIPKHVKWHWIQTGHPKIIAQGRNEWPANVNNWKEAVNYIVCEVVETGARIALIGCGGLSMPIAKMLKERGIIAIVLGGAIQVLFGIKGKRWETHSVISKFWNESWVWPHINETPGAASTIEGGCYWA